VPDLNAGYSSGIEPDSLQELNLRNSDPNIPVLMISKARLGLRLKLGTLIAISRSEVRASMQDCSTDLLLRTGR
jgi:hypothetical protein